MNRCCTFPCNFINIIKQPHLGNLQLVLGREWKERRWGDREERQIERIRIESGGRE